MNFTETKAARFLSGRGFYAVLFLCIAAVGLAAYVGLSSPGAEKTVPEEQSEIIIPYTAGETSQQTEINVPDVEYTEYSEPETEEPPAERAASYFVYPVAGEIQKPFSDTGLLYSATMNDMRVHKGLDIVPAGSMLVCSAGDGTVLGTEETADLGTVVSVDHGNGIIARYCGLKNVKVESGNEVSANTPLGETGTVPSECIEEAHLHFEVIRDGKYIDPESIIGIE